MVGFELKLAHFLLQQLYTGYAIVFTMMPESIEGNHLHDFKQNNSTFVNDWLQIDRYIMVLIQFYFGQHSPIFHLI